MPYDAKVIEVMIASPGDVSAERDIVRDVIAEWNAVHARDKQVVLLPIGWDTHASPELDGRPQQMINDRVLAHADVVVGIFWTRLGTPTGKASSGTVEEVQEHHQTGKPVMLYFSDAPVSPGSVDPNQYAAVKEFRSWAQAKGLVASYAGVAAFKDDFRRHLQQMLQNNAYIRGHTEIDLVQLFEEGLRDAPVALSEHGDTLLRAAAGGDGIVIISRSLDSQSVQTSGFAYGRGETKRDLARWMAAVENLEQQGLIREESTDFYEVTDAGYNYVEAGKPA